VQKLADFMNANPDMVEISIEGHTDELGSDGYNDVLSQQRADMVKVMLVRFGVDAKRLVTKGFGKRRPVSEGHDEAAHQQNRRVEFIITRVRKAGEAQPTTPPQGGP
jgi:outer membrane protein OmpA-like peptidoglycan-associated protein